MNLVNPDLVPYESCLKERVLPDLLFNIVLRNMYEYVMLGRNPGEFPLALTRDKRSYRESSHWTSIGSGV